MKRLSILIPVVFSLCSLTTTATAQDQKLPEVTVVSRNYKYLRSVDNKDVAQPVKLLEHKAQAYDIKNSEYYDDDYDTYYITFYLPKGYILAVYDQKGKLMRTAERYKSIMLPKAVADAIATRFPNWTVTEDIYVVKYNDASGAKKDYKVALQNGDKRMRVRVNEAGEFLD